MAVSHPGKPSPLFLSVDEITQRKAHSVRENSLRNVPLALGVREQGSSKCRAWRSLVPLVWVIFLTYHGTWGQITPLTALVLPDSLSHYLDSLSHLLLSASVLSRCCCCVVLFLLLSDKPTHLCLLCCWCQPTKVALFLFLQVEDALNEADFQLKLDLHFTDSEQQ